MNEFVAWLKNVLKHAIGNVLGQFFTLGGSIFSLSQGDWKVLLGTFIGAILIAVYNWANPSDKRFGFRRK